MLEEQELIVRKEYSQIAPKVEYSLSNIGKEFRTVIDALGEWGNKYNKFLRNKWLQLTSFLQIVKNAGIQLH